MEGCQPGVCIPENAYVKLLDVVFNRLNVIVGAGPRPHIKKTGGENAPVFSAGPPASGRSIGLLWLAYQLRRKGVFVVHLLPSGGMVDNGAGDKY